MADSRPKAHLGVGWSFPVRPVGGRLRYAHHEEDIEQAIPIILRTSPGERAMLPEFGAGARRFVFEPNSPATRRAVETAVREALVDWEPRIELLRVEALPDEPASDPNRILIQVDYRVRATNAFYNRVYPFTLREEGA